MDFPYQPEQLTAEWLTDTLRQAGVLNGTHITSFEVQPLSETAGIVGQNTIIRLAYDKSDDTAPKSIFAKFALATEERRAHWQYKYINEVQFYKEFAHQVDVSTPQAYFSEFEEETGYALLLLEDCSYGELGDWIKGCSIERMRLVVTEIAKFHATWWEHPALPQYAWARMQDSEVNKLQERYLQIADTLDDVPEIPRDPELLQTIKDHAIHFSSWMNYQRQSSPYTLLHNDYHLNNLIFIEDNKLMILDWQTMSMGRGVSDVACLLGKVPIEDRRVHETELLKLYHHTLCENGVVGYSYDQCWDDYRMAIFDGFWKSVFVIANRRQTEAQLNLQRHVLGPRIFAAVLDLNSRETFSRLDTMQI